MKGKGCLQLLRCVCVFIVTSSQELTAIHINIRGIASALVFQGLPSRLTATSSVHNNSNLKSDLVNVRKPR